MTDNQLSRKSHKLLINRQTALSFVEKRRHLLNILLFVNVS